MNKIKKIAGIIALLFLCFTTQAQNSIQPTDPMNTNGKIYVVMAVVIVIVIGLLLYLISLDRKISKMEKK